MQGAKPLKTVKGERIAFTHGLRTPFLRQLTGFRQQSAFDLGRQLVSEMLVRSQIPPELVELLVFGQVIQMPAAPNIAREIVLSSGLPATTDAFSVTRACATSFQSVASVAAQLCIGECQIGIAGGADSSSVLPITLSAKFADALLALSRAKTLAARVAIFRQLALKDLAPQRPSVTEFSTGLRMGDTAEQMAQNWGISREQQDHFAWQSHQRAAQAWNEGRFNQQVMTCFDSYHHQAITQDNTLRPEVSTEKYAQFKPAFSRVGSVTAANSTALTDGAAGLIMMTESRMRELGYEPLGYLRSYHFSATSLQQDMLCGPALATPRALDKAGIGLGDLRLIDMHEAFAAQVLANLKMFNDPRFARDKLDRAKPLGEIDLQRFNQQGGSLAYGHPFAATGARMIIQMLHQLRDCGGGLGLVTACAAGGLGAAMVLEVE